MKQFILPALLLTGLLTACPGPVTPAVTTQSLTVNVSGVASARVTVTDTTANKVLLNDTVTGSRVITGIPRNDVVTVQGAAAPTYTTPAAQTVTLSADQSVTLTYAAAALHTYYDASGVWAWTYTSTRSSNPPTTGTLRLAQDASGKLTGAYLTSSVPGGVDPNSRSASIAGDVDTGTLNSPGDPQTGETYSVSTGAFSGEQYSGTDKTVNTGTTLDTGTFTMTRTSK